MRKNNIPAKTNLSSTHVLKTLQVLMEDDYTMTELVQRLNENEPEPLFNNSVVSKYINTCRYCGIKIPKIQNRYFVSSIPFGMDISEQESDLIKYLQEKAILSLPISTNKKFNKFIMKLSKYSNREIVRIDNSNRDLMVSTFNKAVSNKYKINLMLKNKNTLKCVPLKLLQDNNKLYFKISTDNKADKNISIDNVVGFEVLKDKFIPSYNDETVVYKLMGQLAANYSIRENEKILIDRRPEYITIMNSEKNNSKLVSRLLRYGNLCEIEKPLYIRTEMKKIINTALANYGE